MSPKQILPNFYSFLSGPLNNYTYYIDDNLKIQIDAPFDIMKPVDVIILTHFHFDHIQAVHQIKERTSCEIWATAETIENANNKELFWLSKTTLEADRILDAGDTIETSNFSFKVIKTPGHASGSLCLYDEKKQILVTGDTWFKDTMYGRTDLPTSNSQDLKDSIAKLKELKVKHLCPGHQY